MDITYQGQTYTAIPALEYGTMLGAVVDMDNALLNSEAWAGSAACAELIEAARGPFEESVAVEELLEGTSIGNLPGLGRVVVPIPEGGWSAAAEFWQQDPELQEVAFRYPGGALVQPDYLPEIRAFTEIIGKAATGQCEPEQNLVLVGALALTAAGAVVLGGIFLGRKGKRR